MSYSVTMGTTTIQVSKETQERLKEYKFGGMSYEEVLRFFTSVIPPEEFREAYERWQAKVAEEIRGSDRWKELDL